MATTTRRSAAVRGKQRANAAEDELVDKLSTLVISKPKTAGKQKATPTADEQRLAAMRAVNSALQDLSNTVKSGWRYSSDELPSNKSPAFVKASASAVVVAKHLALLRQLSPESLETERAAGSVLGKLIALEMFDAALVALKEMYPRICYLLKADTVPSRSAGYLYLLAIPPPDSPPTSILLTLATTFLLHALLTVSHLISASAFKKIPDSFTHHLMEAPTLLAWAPLLSSSHVDSVFTGAYSSLIKVASVLQSNPKAHSQVFFVRNYALSCLAHTSPGKIEPRLFWDQTIKSARAYVSAPGSASNDSTLVILNEFARIVTRVQTRVDADSFMSGKGFVSFCEYWMSFANRMGDVATLDRIAIFIGNQPTASKGPTSGIEEPTSPIDTSNNLHLKYTRLCTALAQTTALVDPKGGLCDSDGLSNRLRQTIQVLSEDGTESLLTSVSEDEEIARLSGKLQRAMERTRRSAIKYLDNGGTLADVEVLLETVADIFERSLKTKPVADMVTVVLDTLFVLARQKLNVHDPRTHGLSHSILQRATALLDIDIEDAAVDKANYARCISGAFHNLAGTLYQAGKYGAAILYLQGGCTLGKTALDMHAAIPIVVKEDSKMVEGWRQLEEQLWKRWELLGVCGSKIGDRKLAFESFVNCITGFPYSVHGLATNTRRATWENVFKVSPLVVQLGSIVDRVTFLGACELLLPPERVSLNSLGLSDANITGALLERQIQSLGGSRGKESSRNMIQALLRAALEAYGETDMPVRRTRTLIRCLEFAYHAGPENFAGHGAPSEMGEEVERVLARKNLGLDSDLSFLCAQYRSSAHLWLALHAHRRADPEQAIIVAHHVGLACKILEPLVGLTPTSEHSPKVNRKSLQKQTITPTKRPATIRHPPAPRKAVALRNTVTPQTRGRKGMLPVASAKPPATTANNSQLPSFEDLDKFLDLLQLVSRILGLLNHDLLKVRLLEITRRLCENYSDFATDGYIIASADLALEHMKLGKIKRGNSLFTHSLDAVKSGKVSDDVCVMFYLKHAEAQAMAEDIVKSSELYNEALVRAQRLDIESKGMSTLERVHCRVGRLERAAVASYVYALIQHYREDIAASLEAMLQSLRLWNRALDALTRFNPPVLKNVEVENPFEVATTSSTLKTDIADHAEQVMPPKTFFRRPSLSGLEWRVSEGLLATFFALCEVYFTRGSVREAEYFAQQAHDLSLSLNVPAMAGRALAKKGELQLRQRQLKEAHGTLLQAAELLQNIPGKDIADIQRLCGDYNQLSSQTKDAQQLYEEATRILEGLDQTFGAFDAALAPRKSSELVGSAVGEVLHHELLATVLRQHIWLLRDNGDGHAMLLQRFLSLPVGSRTKAQENGLMGKLTLHEVYGRFRTDMFLSSLTESTIALPMGMSTDKVPSLSPSTHDILHTLDNAEQLFWLDFTLFSRRGDVSRVRDAAVSLALIRALQTSLGKSGKQDPVLVASLLDVSSAITLSREMLEAIQHKFSALKLIDDLQWPLASRNGSPISQKRSVPSRFAFPNNSFGSDLDTSDDETDNDEKSLQDYWEHIRNKYQCQAPDISTLSASQMSGIPQNWTIVHISVTDDKSTLFITRQHGGDVGGAPLVFSVPLKGRRDDEDDEHLTFEDALREFNDIVKLSDEGTRAAMHVKDDPEARARWWKERTALDTRMRELLENIEFCWLGAFKTILSSRANLTASAISDLRVQFDKVFHRSLRFQDKNFKAKPSGTHKRFPSESQIPSKVALDDVLLEYFSTLSPKCRDEELEDLVFFILDLYQFHGVPVAIAEVDIDQVVVDLRGVLEDHHARLAGRRRGAVPAVTKVEEDEHMFLILDKNLQGLPWESIPILRGKSVSRIPSIDFLLDRIKLAGWMTHGSNTSVVADRAAVNPRKGFCILNPSGDLVRTEGRFKGWVDDLEKAGWQSVVGHAPSEQQFLDALRKKDLVVYFGHGGAEQYLRSHKIRNLPRCAATMLWGCSSGTLREVGDFDRVGTPYHYMLAGCPTLVANMWDVTDRDIDIFSQSVFDKLKLTADGVRSWNGTGNTSLVTAVAQSRAACKLKYLTGAAPVVYGIPFYL